MGDDTSDGDDDHASSEPHAHERSVGDRVSAARKIADLTQRQLANRVHISLSLVKKVEQGSTPASPGFIAACSRALGLGVAELTSQPYPVRDREDHRVHAAELFAARTTPPPSINGSTARTRSPSSIATTLRASRPTPMAADPARSEWGRE